MANLVPRDTNYPIPTVVGTGRVMVPGGTWGPQGYGITDVVRDKDPLGSGCTETYGIGDAGSVWAATA